MSTDCHGRCTTAPTEIEAYRQRQIASLRDSSPRPSRGTLNIVASEMVGAVRAIDPETGHYFDDTKRSIDAVRWLTDEDRRKIFEDNARKVYGRLTARLASPSPCPRASR